LASQQTATAATPQPVAGVTTSNYAIGDCTTDQFSISSPGQFGSPIICGTNTGQHMYIDSDGSRCQVANFNIGSSTTTSRSWDIYVTQYTCSQEDEAGPPGCLQYLTGITGIVKSFGFSTSNTATSTAVTTTHLQNQNYQICVRREKGYCYICYAEWATSPGSFGLSVSAIANMATANQGTHCTLDYLVIPHGTTSTIASTTSVAIGTSRYCGRFLNTIADNIAAASVCSRSYPFVVGFTTDDNEAATVGAIDDMADDDETGYIPGGIVGFALGYKQAAC